MTDERVRRLLDGDLPPEEAARLLASLSGPERREAEALLALSRAAAELPRVEPSPDFAARAMARVRARRPPRRTLWTWLRAPALSPLGAAGAAAAAAFLALLAGGEIGRRPSGGAAAPAVVARLTYRDPLARQVAVAGDFNGWKPQASPMRPGANGVWSVEVPVAPGRRYQYLFLVDGGWVMDPGAAATAADGFGGLNAVLQL